MFENLVEILKANPRKIVYTEGTDARILESAARLKKDGFLTPVLIGNVDAVKAAAAKGGFDIEGLEIIDPETYPEMDKFVDDFVALRKGKATAEEARAMLLKSNYFGTMLVKEGLADSLLGGATYSTADTVRPALQLVKTRKGANLVSSCFILVRGKEMLAMGDCAINISYEDKKDKEGNVVLTAAQQLAEVAVETAKTAKVFGIDPKVAMLSFSTKGSGKGPGPELVRNARQHLHLPGDPVRQHRLQDRPASRRLRRLRPHPAGPERPHQRPLPRLQRRGGLSDEHHHRRARLNPCRRAVEDARPYGVVTP